MARLCAELASARRLGSSLPQEETPCGCTCPAHASLLYELDRAGLSKATSDVPPEIRVRVFAEATFFRYQDTLDRMFSEQLAGRFSSWRWASGWQDQPLLGWTLALRRPCPPSCGLDHSFLKPSFGCSVELWVLGSQRGVWGLVQIKAIFGAGL